MEKNIFVNINFLLSALEVASLPKDTGSEVALCGRSNSGKSSVLNALANNKNLARTSKTPGRTQSLNVFSLEENHAIRVIDLPGYGFAKVSKQERKKWGFLINNYLSKRKSLKGLVIIMDIRHPLKESDLILINWCEQTNTPVQIVLNKSDKISKGQSSLVKTQILKALEDFKINTNVIVFSAKKKYGLNLLQDKLNDWLDNSK
ncbi:MAG: ribosome biogenesis GTP-binding protein YihA/YsxC [SAR86 cluster bacterium]|jgi:GTP-binding protein|nr:ribosome biogenesis GTP-binding protein YihA/YsxC [SAR86 cluster bacterium]